MKIGRKIKEHVVEKEPQEREIEVPQEEKEVVIVRKCIVASHEPHD